MRTKHHPQTRKHAHATQKHVQRKEEKRQMRWMSTDGLQSIEDGRQLVHTEKWKKVYSILWVGGMKASKHTWYTLRIISIHEGRLQPIPSSGKSETCILETTTKMVAQKHKVQKHIEAKSCYGLVSLEKKKTTSNKHGQASKKESKQTSKLASKATVARCSVGLVSSITQPSRSRPFFWPIITHWRVWRSLSPWTPHPSVTSVNMTFFEVFTKGTLFSFNLLFSFAHERGSGRAFDFFLVSYLVIAMVGRTLRKEKDYSPPEKCYSTGTFLFISVYGVFSVQDEQRTAKDSKHRASLAVQMDAISNCILIVLVQWCRCSITV